MLVEEDAKLIQASKPTGFYQQGRGIKFVSDTSHYYVKVKPEYTL
ncbi:hypothetical protein [Gilliamella sp. App6-5]|nr:hypothetical protein [Gilliamella apicola]